jgi:hypothetical protein
VTFWNGTQVPHIVRTAVAGILGPGHQAMRDAGIEAIETLGQVVGTAGFRLQAFVQHRFQPA